VEPQQQIDRGIVNQGKVGKNRENIVGIKGKGGEDGGGGGGQKGSAEGGGEGEGVEEGGQGGLLPRQKRFQEGLSFLFC